jgi:hypothetical protein
VADRGGQPAGKNAPATLRERPMLVVNHTHQNVDDAINFTISKAKQIIDMQGDRIFV